MKNKLQKLNKNELIDLLVAYNDYILDFDEDFQSVPLDRTPVCIPEFMDNEWKENYPDTDDEIKKVKVQCLDCGHEFLITCNELYCDELGHFAVCPVCSGSFDVDIKDFDLKEENNNG